MAMEIVYAHEHSRFEMFQRHSIFLAGPSPREEGQYNWRPEAIDALRYKGYRGTIFVPLPRDGTWRPDYDAQVDWELEHLDRASVIAFWIPRDLRNLPGFTTNVEFGLFARSGKIILGYPEQSPKMRYLHHVARKYKVPICYTLGDTLDMALVVLREK